MIELSHSRLKELLHYDSHTGVFTRKVALSPRSLVGDVAGNLTKGYIELSVDSKVYRAHKLAWFYEYGNWATSELDHIDRNKANNAITNLREASRTQNSGNSPRRSTNQSGFKGVSLYGKGFKAAIMKDNKRIHLGVYTKATDAAIAYDEAALDYFGEFALTNKQLGYL